MRFIEWLPGWWVPVPSVKGDCWENSIDWVVAAILLPIAVAGITIAMVVERVKP